MTIRAYRITHKKHLATAFDGEGARINGGRWNFVGTGMVYASSSLSLATLELLVHVEDISTIHDNFSVIAVNFDESLVKSVSPASLPKGWNAPETMAETQEIGGKWIADCSSAVLEVPSAVTPGEVNYLINPAHPDFPKISIEAPMNFEPDSRLASEK
ncbi:RES family NAD+ phosphorylase [bacterium]|nr:RES family NAD+ phosphorylase [bacterium]